MTSDPLINPAMNAVTYSRLLFSLNNAHRTVTDALHDAPTVALNDILDGIDAAIELTQEARHGK